MTPKKSTTRKAGNVENPASKSGGDVMRVPRHGMGQLKVGGSHPRSGRPPSDVRALYANHAAEGAEGIAAILHGEAVKRARVPLSAVLKHAKCPTCGDKLEQIAKDGAALADALMVELNGWESASPSERVKAFDAFNKYGIGTRDEVTLVSPDVRDRLRRTIERIASQPEWNSEALLKDLDTIWSEDEGE